MIDELLGQILTTTLQGKGDSDQHLMTLFSLVLQTKAKNVLELGVRHGDTTLPLSLGCYFTQGQVDAIDIVSTEYKCPEILKPHWNFIQSDAIEFLEKNTKYYDLIVIDDWHSCFSEERNKKISQANGMKILQYDLKNNFIKEWSSLTEASIKTGTNRSSISNCINNKLISTNNFIWRKKL